jgi:hypothetical protein
VTPVFAVQASPGRGSAAGRFWDRRVDSFLGSDPGLNRLRMALQAVLTIGAVVAAEGIFVLGVTVTVSQLYEQLGEFSNSLLLLPGQD